MSKAGDRPDEVRYRLFSMIPSNVATPYPPEIMPENGKDVMLTHPPSTLEFSIPATIHKMSGSFGFISRAYDEGNATDGAEFIIEWIDATDRTRTLFRRFLRPRDVPDDCRPDQQYRVRLDVLDRREVHRVNASPILPSATLA